MTVNDEMLEDPDNELSNESFEMDNEEKVPSNQSQIDLRKTQEAFKASRCVHWSSAIGTRGARECREGRGRRLAAVHS